MWHSTSMYIIGLFGKHLWSMGGKFNSIFLIKVYIEKSHKTYEVFLKRFIQA